MYKIMNEYMSRVSLMADEEIRQHICDILREIKKVRKYSVSEHFRQYVIDIKIKDFSVERAAEVFCELEQKIADPYSAFYMRFNEGSCVHYRFITCREDKCGIYCEILLS